MTLTFEHDLLDVVKVNQHAKYLNQKTFHSRIIVQTHTHTHTHNRPIALPGPLQWSVTNEFRLYARLVALHYECIGQRRRRAAAE